MAGSQGGPRPVDLAPALEERLRLLLADVELATVSAEPMLPGRTSRRGLRPVPIRRLAVGAVVIADVPFHDVRGWKTRPAVVVRARRGAGAPRRSC